MTKPIWTNPEPKNKCKKCKHRSMGAGGICTGRTMRKHNRCPRWIKYYVSRGEN